MNTIIAILLSCYQAHCDVNYTAVPIPPSPSPQQVPNIFLPPPEDRRKLVHSDIYLKWVTIYGGGGEGRGTLWVPSSLIQAVC